MKINKKKKKKKKQPLKKKEKKIEFVMFTFTPIFFHAH